MTGATGGTVEKELLRSVNWRRHWEQEPGVPRKVDVLLSPADPASKSAFSTFQELSRVAGLASVALVNTQPPGYEPTRERWQSSIGPLEWGLASHGYSVKQRLAFLRASGIDPIDMADGGHHTIADLRQPFFPDDGLRGSSSAYGGSDPVYTAVQEARQKWMKYLADANKAAVTELLAKIGQPAQIEIRRLSINAPPVAMFAVSPWSPGQDLPVTQSRRLEELFFQPGVVAFLPLPSNTATRGGSLVADQLRSMAKNPSAGKAQGVVLDLTAYESSEALDLLDRWFGKPKASLFPGG
jgi:hypothetical protein